MTRIEREKHTDRKATGLNCQDAIFYIFHKMFIFLFAVPFMACAGGPQSTANNQNTVMVTEEYERPLDNG